MDSLVSVITPCYNGQKWLKRYLESIINQTYKNIELIFINDGSTDDTEKIILSYKEKFLQKGIKLIYKYQENQGLGGAINTGLKYFNGDYICWADADDYLELDSIEKRVRFLENNLQFGCVSSDANVYIESDLENPIYRISEKSIGNNDENQFEKMLKSESIFCCGCHMIRSSSFLDVNKEREIYPAKRGQNWQMLLPVYYKYKRGYIDEPLYNYIIHEKSMSSGDDTEEKKINRCNEHIDIVKNTLNRIDMPESERIKYFKDFEKKYIIQKYDIAMEYRDVKLAIRQFISMKRIKCLRKNDFKSLIKMLIVRG